MLLLAIGDSVFTTADLLSMAFAPPSDERMLATQQIARMSSVRAPDSVAADIGIRVLESLFGNRPLTFVGDTAGRAGFWVTPGLADSVAQFVSMDSLPDAVRQRAAALGHEPVPRGWMFPAGSTGYTTRIGPVRRMGSFYAVDVTHTTLFARGAVQSGGYANGCTMWFIEGAQGWVVFNSSSWVT